MRYEWDNHKKIANKIKHGVDFESASDFEWDSALEALDTRETYGEERWIAIGLISKRLHVLIYTFRGNNIRLISLRKANDREVTFYEENRQINR